MKSTLSRIAAAASFAFAAPLLAVSALANDGAQESTEQTASEQAEASAQESAADTAPAAPVTVAAPAAPEPEPAETPVAAQEPVEEERICRSIRVDMSSRRKTRVCLTEEGWRNLNQQR
jgi:hypothetical protein